MTITLDGENVKTAYGVIAVRGSFNDLMKLPDMKPVSNYSWPTEHGDDHNLDNRKMAARDINLTWLMSAATMTALNNQRDAPISVLTDDGERSLYIEYLGKTFTMYYVSCESAALSRGSKFLLKLNLKFRLVLWQ